jgi:hypothetical protein
LQISDVLRLKCTAKIGNAYWESVVESTILKKHYKMMESRSNIAVLGKIKFLINACDEIFFLRDLIDLHNFYLK